MVVNFKLQQVVSNKKSLCSGISANVDKVSGV